MTLGKTVDVHILRHSPSTLQQPKTGARPRSLVNFFGGQRSASSGQVPTASSGSPKSSDLAVPLAAGPTSRIAGDTLHAMMTIPAWTIEKALITKRLSKAMQESLAVHIESSLNLGDPALTEMVFSFIRRFHPTSKTPTQVTSPAPDPNANLEDYDLANADSVVVTAAVQEFFHDVRQKLDELNKDRTMLSETPNLVEKQTTEPVNVEESLEKIEAFVCEVLYDK